MVYYNPMDKQILKLVCDINDNFDSCRLTIGYDNSCDLFEIEVIDENDIPIYVALGRTIEEAIAELYEKTDF